jgi:ssDNA-binding Zn-finger/Zn-ribbon topoisomerase 1
MTQEPPIQPKDEQNRVVCDECGHEVVLIRTDGQQTLRCSCGTERALEDVKPIPTGWLA